MHMMHLLAYRIASAGGVTNQDVPGVTDGFASLQNNHYILQADWFIRWAAAFGVNLTNARINTPRLRTISLPSIQPVETAVTPGNLPGISWFDGGMLKIAAIDETAMEMTDTAGAGNLSGLVGLVDQLNNNIPAGPVSVLRATATITVGNGVWGQGTFTFDQTLPAGRYAVIGMDVVGANLIGARLLFQGGGPRPGVVARTAVANKPDWNFLSGYAGNWGEFESTAQPLIELFGNAAPTTQTIFLKVVKIR
jgi:hypothetical protein